MIRYHNQTNNNVTSMTINLFLQKNNNNLDLIRIIAALLVIYGHAYAISPEYGTDDIVSSILKFDYSGSLAVKIFFFISGLVVTNSLFHKKNTYDYIVSRIFRIWPALLVVVIAAYIISILMTTLTIGEFFSSLNFIPYIIKSLFLQFTWDYPGVFTSNNISAFNGSLWTIPYEVSAYIILLFVSMMLRFNKLLCTIASIIIIIDSSLGLGYLFTNSYFNDEVRYLPLCFSIGSLFAINKNNIEINITSVIFGCIILYILKLNDSIIFIPFFYFVLFYSILYISSISMFVKLKPPHDISYGIYLWGFPVQQIIVFSIGNHGVLLNQVLSMILASILGYLSWILIEKKSMALGKSILFRIKGEA